MAIDVQDVLERLARIEKQLGLTMAIVQVPRPMLPDAERVAIIKTFYGQIPLTWSQCWDVVDYIYAAGYKITK